MSSQQPLGLKIIKKVKVKIENGNKVLLEPNDEDVAGVEVISPPPQNIISPFLSDVKIESSSQGSTDHLDEENIFMVPPLLAVRLFAHQERIPIGIDEIRRRISPPESLSQGLLLSLLRLNKEKAKQLRSALAKYGILELPGRSAVVSSFSRLSEAESCGLAEDYFYLASRHMRVREMHQSLTIMGGGRENISRKAVLTKKYLNQIQEEIGKRHTNLNLLTHEFGSLIMRSVFQIIIELISFNESEHYHSDQLDDD